MDLTFAGYSIQDLRATLALFPNDQGLQNFLKDANALEVKCGSQSMGNIFIGQSSREVLPKRHPILPIHLSDCHSIPDMGGLQHDRPEEESKLELFKRELYFPSS